MYPLRHTSGSVWLASRDGGYFWQDGTGDYQLNVRYFDADGSVSSGTVESQINGIDQNKSVTYGVRPVVSLKTGLRVTGGDGTESSPYILDF